MEGENYIDNSNCKGMDTNCRMTLRKGEKLRHRSLVENLFRKGDSLYEFPIRLTWQTMDNDELENTFCDHVPDRIDRLQMLNNRT